MGIQGLLPFLEKATKPCHISEFRGATVVVDTYCWLHKGATTCAIQLLQGEETNMYVNYCIKYIKMLQSYDIRPILVFDGKNLPAKAVTEAKRRESRKNAKQRAAELLKLGKAEEARSYLKASLNISPEMASMLIKECHKMKVDCIVAPYESDAQLAFFNVKGIAEFVITEDSDLILFGCSKVFYKLDLRGCGYLVEAEKICASMNIRPDKYTFDKFRYMCILSGCDYVDSLHGVGLKKAQKFITLTDEANPEIFLEKVPRYLNLRNSIVTEEYKTNFMMAVATFRHQIVFDPFRRKLVPLFDPQLFGTNPKYCENAGEIYDHEKAYQVALGNLHPSSFKKLNSWDPSKANLTNKSIWYDGSYERSVSRKMQKQKSVFKEYFNTNKLEMKLEIDDSHMRMEDDKINKELEFYSKPPLTQETEEVASPEEEHIDKESEKTSPVLNKNPFIKKISRFQRTETNSSTIVISRYFSSHYSEVQDIPSVEEDTVKNDEDTVKNDKIDNVVEKTTTDGRKIENASMVHDSEDGITAPSVEFSALELMEAKTEFHVNESKYFSPSQSQSTVSSKRKVLGPCRTVGLKKVKSQGQQTISTFFRKLDKPT